MKTINELLDLASQGKLAEIDTLAWLVQGFKIDNYSGYDYRGDRKDCFENFHPTRDKAQAWDLMVKEGLGLLKMRNGDASDMTGGYVDQKDLAMLLANPSKKTAKKCMEQQILYWFQVGTEDGELVERDRLIEENEDVRKIAIDYGFIDDEE